jgi:DNA-binding GntR family transcriptional regulator
MMTMIRPFQGHPRSGWSFGLEEAEMNAILPHFGRAIQLVRIDREMSQTQLCDEMERVTGEKIYQSTLSRVENGEAEFSASQFIAALHALRCPFDEFIKWLITLARVEGEEDEVHIREVLAERYLLTNDEHAADQIYATIKCHILNRFVAPGHVYLCDELEKGFGCDHASVCDALQRLAQEHFLEMFGRNAIVVQHGAQYVLALFRRRIYLECKVIAELLKRSSLSLDELDRIHAQLEALDTSADASCVEFTDLDLAFHRGIARLAGYGQYAPETTKLVREIIIAAPFHQGRCREVIAEHRAIIRALGAGDKASILDAIREHMDSSARWLKSALQQREDWDLEIDQAFNRALAEVDEVLKAERIG